MGKSKFGIYLVFVLIAISVSQECKDAKLHQFPHQAVVRSNVTCGGALISANHVLTLANCVCGFKEVTVYLGLYEQRQLYKAQGQMYRSRQIIIHDSFIQISPVRYINNIAIVVLSHPAKLCSSIQPIALSTEASLPGSYANVSGWTVTSNNKLKYCKTSILNTDTCIYKFGSDILPNQQLCLKWHTSSRMNLIGNTVTANGRLVGFQTFTPKCLKTTNTCTGNDLILNIFPFVKWIQTLLGIEVKNANTCANTCEQQQITQQFKEHLLKINKDLERLSTIQRQDTTEIFLKIKNVTEQCQQSPSKDKVDYQKEISELRSLIETNKLQLANMEKIQNTTLDRINELKNNISQQYSESQRLNKLMDTETIQRKSDIDKQMKLIEDIDKNNTRDVNEKLQYLSDEIVTIYKNLSAIKHKLDQKPTDKDILELNKQFITNEIKKENQHIINDMTTVNNTLQNLLQKLQTNIIFPELT